MAVSPSSSESSETPKSTHVTDSTLQPFLQPKFDPADYLNATLPSLSLSSVASRPLKQGNAAPLADLSSRTQDLLSQLNAHTTRLSTILTQLTDDILRSGGRLAYEVEVLRGETIGLTDTLTEGLNEDIPNFIPEGISLETQKQEEEQEGEGEEEKQPTEDKPPEASKPASSSPTAPPEISQLATLHTIRSRLESVIRIFGEATRWTLPPSEVSLTSSLISVSASDTSDLETRGRDFAASLRAEIADLVIGAEEPPAGAAAAAERIQALRELAQVWKGTAEEKARVKFVEGLVKLAEEKERERMNAWNARQAQQQQQQRPRAGTGSRGRSGSVKREKEDKSASAAPQKSGGFLDNLQRLKEEFL